MNAPRLGHLSGEKYADCLAYELREMVMSVCDGEGVALHARFRFEREDRVRAMGLAGIGFAYMHECSVNLPGLIRRPLIEPATVAHLRATRHVAWPG